MNVSTVMIRNILKVVWFESHSRYLMTIMNPRITVKFITWRQKLGRPECPYMERWAINFGKLGSIRLHHWWRSDDARNRHDHPADFITLVLKGSYTDLGEEERTCPCGGTEGCPNCHGGNRVIHAVDERMTPGKIRRRNAEHRHTVKVDPGGCWTLLYFFPERRKWGFWVPRKLDGKLKFVKANKYFLENGHHPCDQP